MNSAGPRDQGSLNQGRQEQVNYLLGLLPEAERDRLRERLICDQEEFERLRDTENELFDGYARGTLAPGQRAAFERTLLRQAEAPAKLRAARALIAQRPARRRPALLWMMAAAALLAAGFLLFAPMPSPQAERPGAAAPVVAVVAQAFPLLPLTRASQTQRLALDAATTAIDFSAERPAGAPQESYAVEISRAGKAVWSGDVAVAKGELRWRVPRPEPGSYVVRVGPPASPLAFFEFTI